MFDESRLYNPAVEQLEGQPVAQANEVATEIAEDESISQDAGMIVENLGFFDDDTLQSGEPAEPSNDVPSAPVTDTEHQKGQNSGVSSNMGLLTPDKTPEPMGSVSGVVSGGEERQPHASITAGSTPRSTASAQSTAHPAHTDEIASTTGPALERRSVGG